MNLDHRAWVNAFEYDVIQLVGATSLFEQQETLTPEDQVRSNALLESALLAARRLHEFLSTHSAQKGPGKEDNICWEDVMPGEVACPTSLGKFSDPNSMISRLHKHLAHSTVQRDNSKVNWKPRKLLQGLAPHVHHVVDTIDSASPPWVVLPDDLRPRLRIVKAQILRAAAIGPGLSIPLIRGTTTTSTIIDGIQGTTSTPGYSGVNVLPSI